MSASARCTWAPSPTTCSLSRSPEPTVDLTLACAVLARQRMHLVVQKATELGVRRIVPLLTERTEVKLDGEDLLALAGGTWADGDRRVSRD